MEGIFHLKMKNATNIELVASVQLTNKTIPIKVRNSKYYF